MAEAAGDLRGGGSGRQRDGLPFDDELGGRDGDPSFLVGESFLAQGEGGVEAKGLIGHLAGELHGTVGAVDETALLELGEVAPDAGGGGIQLRGQIVDAALPFLQEQMEDLVGAILCLLGQSCHSFARGERELREWRLV